MKNVLPSGVTSNPPASAWASSSNSPCRRADGDAAALGADRHAAISRPPSGFFPDPAKNSSPVPSRPPQGFVASQQRPSAIGDDLPRAFSRRIARQEQIGPASPVLDIREKAAVRRQREIAHVGFRIGGEHALSTRGGGRAARLERARAADGTSRARRRRTTGRVRQATRRPDEPSRAAGACPTHRQPPQPPEIRRSVLRQLAVDHAIA